MYFSLKKKGFYPSKPLLIKLVKKKKKKELPYLFPYFAVPKVEGENRTRVILKKKYLLILNFLGVIKEMSLFKILVTLKK